MKINFYLLAITLNFAIAIDCAYAANFQGNDTITIENSQISLVQAVTVAERYVGGKAVRAEFKHHKDWTTFDIEVVKDKIIRKVKVDPMSGRIILSIEDKNDEKE